MSTRSKTAAIIASAGVLAAGWAIGTANGQTLAANPTTTTTTTASGGTTSGTMSSATSAGTTSSATSAGSTASGTSSGSTASSAGNYTDGTYTGTTVSERYGTETVTVTVSGGKITEVTAQSTIYEQHSQRYVERAVPTLRSEVLAAQSADVNMVSGATYTSQAYLSSLQSALDQASA